MKYMITVKSVEYLTLEVEADSLDEAKQIAECADGSEFESDPCPPDWYLSSIEDENGNITSYE